jgi:type III secretion apparatus needle protein
MLPGGSFIGEMTSIAGQQAEKVRQQMMDTMRNGDILSPSDLLELQMQLSQYTSLLSLPSSEAKSFFDEIKLIISHFP